MQEVFGGAGDTPDTGGGGEGAGHSQQREGMGHRWVRREVWLGVRNDTESQENPTLGVKKSLAAQQKSNASHLRNFKSSSIML